MTVDDEIDTGHLTGNAGAHILTRNARRDGVVARWLVQSRVQEHDDDVRTGRARRLYRFAHRGNDVTNHNLSSQVVAIPQIRAGCRATDERDLHALSLDHFR